ncbi:MAG: hypothetical protein LBE78_09910 [Burkholderiaceae bacterium]|jgi:hypothetical protein|nr:hypothetical protein [Burkholderiaceae bacterium]
MKSIYKLTAVIACGLALTACGGDWWNDDDDDDDIGGKTPTFYLVTPSVSGGSGAISPAAAVSVQSGSTTSFQVTPNTDYTASIGGSCGGTLNGTTYTTKAITADCTVAISFAQTDTEEGAGTIANCFTVPETVNYNWLVMPDENWQVRTGAATFDGQEAIEQTFFMPNNEYYKYYWKVTSNEVRVLGYIIEAAHINSTHIYNPLIIRPADMKPGYFIDSSGQRFPDGLSAVPGRSTFMGFKTITLAGKQFPDACLFRTEEKSTGLIYDEWYAFGYGLIKRWTIKEGTVSGANGIVSTVATQNEQYNGDLAR